MSLARRLKKLILPPSSCLLVGFAGLLMQASATAARPGLALIALSLVALHLLSAPVIVSRWLAAVDRYPRFDPALQVGPPPQAIVVLDGGRHNAAPERGGETVTARTLERLDEGARLHRVVSLPILVTGYGELMARVLDESFAVAAGWTENRSRNTHENARNSARILRRAGVERIYLVTHFWHLRRSLAAFRHAGLAAVPVPAGRAALPPSDRGLLGLVPDARALASSFLLSHEAVGMAWYRLRYRYRRSHGTE